jgi:hypothetical protein
MGMGDENPLPAGQHVYPFSFQLPPNLPSSFEGGTGHVRYSIKGTIDKPWKFDHTTKRPLTVLASLDLNTQPNAEVSQITKQAGADPGIFFQWRNRSKGKKINHIFFSYNLRSK